MVATITLQLDDQTGPGWALFIENVRKAEQQANVLQQSLDMHTAVVEARSETEEIQRLTSALQAATERARTLNDCLPGGPVQRGLQGQTRSPAPARVDRESAAFDDTGGALNEAVASSAELAQSRRQQAFDAGAIRQQFQQEQLGLQGPGQGLESERAGAQNQLLQIAVSRARVQGKVDKQIIQMLTDQIELEQQQQQAAQKTGQMLEKFQAALLMLLNASNNVAQQNRQQNQGGP